MFENLLISAVQKGMTNLVRALLVTKVNVNIVLGDSYVRTPLHEAVLSGNQKLITMLLKAGADANIKDNHGYTPLTYAINQDYTLQLARILIEAQGNVNCVNFAGQTALHLAAKKSDVKMIRFLIRMGANVESRDDFNRTPLHHAVDYNETNSHVEAIRVLLNNGAQVNALDRGGFSPLMKLACSKFTDIEIFKMLCLYGAHIHVRNNDGETILVLAARSKNFEIVQFLVEAGCDVNGKSSLSTPLHEACTEYDDQMVKYLMKKGANVNACDFLGRTPLTMFLLFKRASESYDVMKKNIQFLLKYTDINAVDKFGDNLMAKNLKRGVQFSWKFILQHIAKMKALDIEVDSRIMDAISEGANFKVYFERCLQELALAKETNVPHSGVSFFSLLVENKQKLLEYASDDDLFKHLEVRHEQFPIFGSSILKNVVKGIKRRLLVDNSVAVLIRIFPLFKSHPKIMRDILAYLDNKKLLDLYEVNECIATV